MCATYSMASPSTTSLVAVVVVAVVVAVVVVTVFFAVVAAVFVTIVAAVFVTVVFAVYNTVVVVVAVARYDCFDFLSLFIDTSHQINSTKQNFNKLKKEKFHSAPIHFQPFHPSLRLCVHPSIHFTHPPTHTHPSIQQPPINPPTHPSNNHQPIQSSTHPTFIHPSNTQPPIQHPATHPTPSHLPTTASQEELKEVKVEYLTMAGWKENTTGLRSFHQLPLPAQQYVLKLQELTGVPSG